MKHFIKTKQVLQIVFIVSLFSVIVLAQSGGNFEIKKSVIANGGGESSNGKILLKGTIGQPIVSTSEGGNFSLNSGFWNGSENASPTSATKSDFDGDFKTDISIFRPNLGQWWILKSSDGGNFALQFGASTDKIVPADYTGDGKTDIAFFRPSNSEWFILRSENSSFYSFQFGTNGDIPAPGDFDGDGKDDVAIFRPSNSQWWINRSTEGIQVFQFGTMGDKTVQGDYTGDGKADVAFWRSSSGEWFVIRSENASFYSFPFGTSTDIPSPGDYDGDGKFDAAVFRSSNITWSKSVPVKLNNTYVVRSIAYRNYEFVKPKNASDVLVVFRVIRKDDEGNITILWKELTRKYAPSLSENKK